MLNTVVLRHGIQQPALQALYLVQSFSILNRPPPNYEGHVPLTTIERVVLGAGAGIAALLNIRRHGMSRNCVLQYQ